MQAALRLAGRGKQPSLEPNRALCRGSRTGAGGMSLRHVLTWHGEVEEHWGWWQERLFVKVRQRKCEELSGGPDTCSLVGISGGPLLNVVPWHLPDLLVSPFLPLLLTGFFSVNPFSSGGSWYFRWPINAPASPEPRLTKAPLLSHSFLLRRKGERVDTPGREGVETAIRQWHSYNFSLWMWVVMEKMKSCFSQALQTGQSGDTLENALFTWNHFTDSYWHWFLSQSPNPTSVQHLCLCHGFKGQDLSSKWCKTASFFLGFRAKQPFLHLGKGACLQWWG